jgi:hypothetical protein
MARTSLRKHAHRAALESTIMSRSSLALLAILTFALASEVRGAVRMLGDHE